MKIKKLGTLGIIGVVLSITAACGGSPTKPTASNPAIGGGAPASPVPVSSPRLVADDHPCTSLAPVDDQTGDANAEAAPAMTCDAPAAPAADEEQGEVVIGDSSVMDDLFYFKR